MVKRGTVVYGVDPLVILDHYEIDYTHSYAQDSPFFVGLSQGKLLGSACKKCDYKFATPRAYCMNCGKKSEWFNLPLAGRVHTYTTCYYGSEAFLAETPFTLILAEFRGVDTLLLSRLKGVDPEKVEVGMKVRAEFSRRPEFKVTDFWFVAAD